ncbi:hypothetical protein CPT_Moabite_078 [Serratia phage Moabite]|uniref:Uncharacterized protein n=1 Tax=Serratia phage Moabite TaxID=2587814 RepID=A0A4Y5TP16_9CAUD|nr:hypothetical protein HWC48_gp338 [Serratia phage Moabite]QDB71108.1 hypothetical protein CPT_Moabite_078 [Serratia phage Moabite]
MGCDNNDTCPPKPWVLHPEKEDWQPIHSDQWLARAAFITP